MRRILNGEIEDVSGFLHLNRGGQEYHGGDRPEAREHDARVSVGRIFLTHNDEIGISVSVFEHF
jgi:hypothetical protein